MFENQHRDQHGRRESSERGAQGGDELGVLIRPLYRPVFGMRQEVGDTHWTCWWRCEEEAGYESGAQGRNHG